MVKGIDKKYIEEVRKLKEGRKPPGISIKSIIKREITKASIGQLITLPILIGLLVFFLKAESISTILAVLGVILGITIFILIFGGVTFNKPYNPNALPTEPDLLKNKPYSTNTKPLAEVFPSVTETTMSITWSRSSISEVRKIREGYND